jgi:hypothetical protein
MFKEPEKAAVKFYRLTLIRRDGNLTTGSAPHINAHENPQKN